ncbi:hypothetical protein LguiA_035131 [Lonicera macranthoides]
MAAIKRDVLLVEYYNQFQFIVRCPLPPLNYSTAVDLRRKGSRFLKNLVDGNGLRWSNQTIHSWERDRTVGMGRERESELLASSLSEVRGKLVADFREREPSGLLKSEVGLVVGVERERANVVCRWSQRQRCLRYQIGANRYPTSKSPDFVWIYISLQFD